MIVYCMLGITLLFGFFSIYLAWISGSKTFSAAFPGLLLSVSMALFIYLYGVWVFVSVYAKFLFAVIFLVVLVVRMLGKHKTGGRSGYLANFTFAGLFILLDVLYFTGTTGKPYGIARLAAPFKHGQYLVFQGGEGLPTNLFHYKLRGAVYAMDIVKLFANGNRARHIFSANLNDYAIYGDTIYSPCNARVLKVRDSNVDHIPPHINKGTGGINMVLLETADEYVFLGHLKEGSIMVKDGDSVITGQPLACAGNSGFTLEPHLHIQVQAKTNPAIPWYKEKPLLINFNGRAYGLFDVINCP